MKVTNKMGGKLREYPGNVWGLAPIWKEEVFLGLRATPGEEIRPVSKEELADVPILTYSRLIASPVSSNMEDKDGMRFPVNPIISPFSSLGNFRKRILAINRAPPELSSEKSQE